MEVSLELECHLEKESLHVRYAVTNHGRLPLLAYDGAPGKPADAPWPDLKYQVYVSVFGDAVALKRVNPPQPPGVLMTASYIPPLSQTMPGERRELHFQLTEPLVEISQYTPDNPGAHYRERQVHQVQLFLGCFWQTAEMKPVPFSGMPKSFQLHTAHGPTSILSANATQTVNVRERTDSGFFRT